MTFRTIAVLIITLSASGLTVSAKASEASQHLKPIVAVSSFENRSSYQSDATYTLSNALADQLTDGLIQTDAYVVLERQAIGQVLAEQDGAMGDRVSRSQSARIGQLTGAQVLVMGVITDFDLDTGKSGAGVSFGNFRIGKSKQKAHVALIVRLVDTTTGEVLASREVSAEAKASKTSLGLDIKGITFDGTDFQKTPLGEATKSAIEQAVHFIAEKARQVRFQARVIQVDDEAIVISAGERNNVGAGTMFTVMSVGRELKDPFTGELLGYDQSPIGRITINRVFDRFAYAAPANLADMVKVGDFVVIE